jgi:hypothetical protein
MPLHTAALLHNSLGRTAPSAPSVTPTRPRVSEYASLNASATPTTLAWLQVGEYVKSKPKKEEEGFIEVELCGGEGEPNVVVSRTIKVGASMPLVLRWDQPYAVGQTCLCLQACLWWWWWWWCVCVCGGGGGGILPKTHKPNFI